MTLAENLFIILYLVGSLAVIGMVILAYKLSMSKKAYAKLLSEKNDLEAQKNNLAAFTNRYHEKLQQLRLKAARNEFNSNAEVLFIGCNITNGIITIPAGYLSDVEERILNIYNQQPDGTRLLATHNLQTFLRELKQSSSSSGAGIIA